MGSGFGGPAVDLGRLNSPTALVVSAHSWPGDMACTHSHVTPRPWDPRPSRLFFPLHLNGQDLFWRSKGGNTFKGFKSLLNLRGPRSGFICLHCFVGSALCRDFGSIFPDLQLPPATSPEAVKGPAPDFLR